MALFEAIVRLPSKMPRNVRRVLPGVPLHLLQRGNDRMPCFREDSDRTLYMGLLCELAADFGCEIHAYVLMTNHVHLLVTPQDVRGPSGLMKNLGQRYAQSFNRAHGRTGTMWEGRFRSNIVDSETYLFTCHRYIELNPVRAGMVGSPWQYPWSSHRANAGLEKSLLLAPHRAYAALGATEDEREERYRALFQHPPCASELEAIRHCINTGAVLGSDSFLRRMEEMTGRFVRTRSRGRPKATGVLPRGKKKLTPV